MNALYRSSVAALVLGVPVVAETTGLIDDGGASHLLFALTQIGGWLLLASVSRSLALASRTGRWDTRLVLAGTGCLALFGVLYLVTFLVAGEPAGWIFVTFLVGFPLLTVGSLTWSRRLWRGSWRTSAVGLALVGVLGLGAIVLSQDPFHDIALVGSYLAWVVVGRGTVAREALAPESALSASSR